MRSQPSDPPVTDLLRERRLELGLAADPPLQRPTRTLLLAGAGSGLLLVVLSLVALPLLAHRERQLQTEVDRLAPVEQRVGAARARIGSLSARTKALEQATSQIASQLVGVRSGSALLEQLRRTTPEGVRLLSVTLQPGELLISGEADGFGAYERINAFQLNLEGLENVAVRGARVLKASAEADGLVAFSINAALDTSFKPTPEQLRDLGAEGLAIRYELLEAEGVPL